MGGNETVPADHAATCESVQEDAYNERILERKPIKIQRNPSSRFHKPKIKITQPSFDCDAIPDCWTAEKVHFQIHVHKCFQWYVQYF